MVAASPSPLGGEDSALSMVMQFNMQSHAYRGLLMYNEGRLFPAGWFAEVTELGPHGNMSGPSLVLFEGMDVAAILRDAGGDEIDEAAAAAAVPAGLGAGAAAASPLRSAVEVVEARVRATSVEPVISRIYWVLARPVAADLDGLARRLESSALPAPSLPVRVQCWPRKLEEQVCLSLPAAWDAQPVGFGNLLEAVCLPDGSGVLAWLRAETGTFKRGNAQPKRNLGSVCRASSKLVEALEICGLGIGTALGAEVEGRDGGATAVTQGDAAAETAVATPPPPPPVPAARALPLCGLVAVDVGAAPGGWSVMLADAGARVVAVDPALLGDRAAAHPRIRHVRSMLHRSVESGEFAAALAASRVEAVADAGASEGPGCLGEGAAAALAGAGGIDLLVCDINAKPGTAAGFLSPAIASMVPGSHLVLTLKLSTKKREEPRVEELSERALAAHGVCEPRMHWLMANTVFERTLIARKARV